MHYAEFQKNLMEQFQENIQMEGRTEKDGWQIKIHRILPAAAGDPESYA